MIAKRFELPRWRAEMERAEARFETLVAGRSVDDLMRSVEAGAWCVVDAVEHLEMTVAAFLPLWDAALLEARVGNDSGKYGWIQRAFLWSLEPPYRVKLKTRPGFVPSREARLESVEEIVERFRAMQRDVAERGERLDRRDPSSVKVASPFAKGLEYPIGFSFDVVVTHERRHVWQMEQIVSRIA